MQIKNLVLRVDRRMPLEELLKDTGGFTFFPNCGRLVPIPRMIATEDNYLAKIPNTTEEEVEIIFFSPDLGKKYISFEEILVEYKVHDLKPVDVYSLAAANANEENDFSYYHPNLTYWVDEENNFHLCYFCEYQKSGFKEREEKSALIVYPFSEFKRFVRLEKVPDIKNTPKFLLPVFRSKNLLLAGVH